MARVARSNKIARAGWLLEMLHYGYTKHRCALATLALRDTGRGYFRLQRLRTCRIPERSLDGTLAPVRAQIDLICRYPPVIRKGTKLR
jgi:hypothetical protein